MFETLLFKQTLRVTNKYIFSSNYLKRFGYKPIVVCRIIILDFEYGHRFLSYVICVFYVNF